MVKMHDQSSRNFKKVTVVSSINFTTISPLYCLLLQTTKIQIKFSVHHKMNEYMKCSVHIQYDYHSAVKNRTHNLQ